MGYPWQIGDALLASDLNAAIAGMGAGGAVNVLDHGADPTGVADSSDAINAAAAVAAPNGTRRSVYLPAGKYRVNKQINLTLAQSMIGDTRGASFLYVDDRFDPAATAVILCTSGFYDPGPVIRDIGIQFAQPQDQASRANFKTLAAGGTSGAGGTGVKYPWAIAAGSDSGRIQIIRVRISNAWDGITSNGYNAVFWLDDIEMGALDCGLSLGEGASGILDFVHINSYHFWNFDITGALQSGVFGDGQTVAMRVGRVDGLNIKDFSSHQGRLIVTSDSNNNSSIHIANCMMDTDQATIEVNGGLLQFSIANMSGSAGGNRQRALVTLNAPVSMSITNHYSLTQSSFPEFLLTNGAAILRLENFRCLFYPAGTPWVRIQAGIVTIINGHLFSGGPRTVAAISETGGGILVIDNVTVTAGTPSGPLISMVASNALTSVGRLQLEAGNGWTFSLPSTLTQTFYSPQTALPALRSSASYASDAAAAAGGVAVGQLYRNGSAVMVRVT